MIFLRDITSRDGKASSKKLWFNIACFTSTVIVTWMAYLHCMEDYAFIALFSVYLVTVGGFEVIPKMLGMMIEFKNGKGTTTNTTITTKEVA